jgi:hypothetical protein
MAGTPVDYDPFATASGGGTPVDYDPFNEQPTGVSPMAETGGGAALMYPTGKRRQIAEPTDISATKIAETIFGKGTPMNVPESERMAKIGETALATGALTSVDDVAIKKIIGRGMINVPNDNKIDLLKVICLTKKLIKQLQLVHVIVIFNRLVNKCRMVNSLNYFNRYSFDFFVN